MLSHSHLKKTLPKAQRTRGLSSAYQSNLLRSCHEFLQKSYSNFILRILTENLFQNINIKSTASLACTETTPTLESKHSAWARKMVVLRNLLYWLSHYTYWFKWQHEDLWNQAKKFPKTLQPGHQSFSEEGLPQPLPLCSALSPSFSSVAMSGPLPKSFKISPDFYFETSTKQLNL